MKLYRKIIAALVGLAMLIPSIGSAAGSYTVYNLPIMYLATGISATQTSSITLAGPYRNSDAVTVPAMSGAVFQFSQFGNSENIYAGRVAVNQTTGVITLTSIIRDLCFNQSITFTGCSTGHTFQKGAQVVLTDDARLFNLKANLDRQNSFTGSGAIAFNGSGSFALPTFATIALRNQEMGATPGGPVRGSCVTATGLCYLYIGGSWQSIANSGIGNASDSVAGIVQLGPLADLRNLTATGSTGAPDVLGFKWIVKNGTGTVTSGRVPQTNGNGVISTTLGGTGTGGLRGVASGALLIAQGTGAYKAVYPGAKNTVLQSDGKNVSFQTAQSSILRDTRTADGTQVGASSVVKWNTGSGTVLSGSTLTVGDAIQLSSHFSSNEAAGRTMSGTLWLGNNMIFGSNTQALTEVSHGYDFDADFTITIRSVGASGSVQVVGTIQSNGVVTYIYQTTSSIDFTSNERLQWAVKFTGSNASNFLQEKQFVPVIFKRTY